MSSGPQHYREAERILAEQKDAPERLAHLSYACAQAHATLALAAATALAAMQVPAHRETAEAEYADWMEATQP